MKITLTFNKSLIKRIRDVAEELEGYRPSKKQAKAFLIQSLNTYADISFCEMDIRQMMDGVTFE